MVVKRVKRGIDKCILVDFDSKFLNPMIEIEVIQCLAIMRLDLFYIRYDQTRRGWHVIIAIKQSLTKAETLLAQSVICAAIGGDWKREAFNFRRACCGVYLNQLFEPLGANKK